MSDKIDKNINSNNKNVDDCAEPESIETIAIVNTVLAYIHYGISNATPGNVIEVVLGYFTGEVILDAKLNYGKNVSWETHHLAIIPGLGRRSWHTFMTF